MDTNNTFTITDDKSADWAVRCILEEETERDRLIALAEQQIKDLNDKIEHYKSACENQTAYLKGCLSEYMSTVKPKETKTQKTYKLVSGTLVYKKPSTKIIHDDVRLIEALAGTEYVETKQSLKWGEYKKSLTIDGDKVIDTTTGEIIDACTVEDVPGTFTIKEA